MKYDVKCNETGCDGHFRYDDLGSETPPPRCIFCGSEKIKAAEVDEEKEKAEMIRQMDQVDEPGSLSSSTIALVKELVLARPFEEIFLAMAALDALLPYSEDEMYDASGFSDTDIKTVANFLKDLNNTTGKFVLDYRSWGRSLYHYIYNENHGVETVVNILKDKDNDSQAYRHLFNAVWGRVYDCFEE